MVSGERRRPAASSTGETVMGSPPNSHNGRSRSLPALPRPRQQDRALASPRRSESQPLVNQTAGSRPERACGGRQTRRSLVEERGRGRCVDVWTSGVGVGGGFHVSCDGALRDRPGRRGTLVLYGQSSGPVEPFDPGRLSGITGEG